MNRKTFKISIIFLLIVLAGGAVYLCVRNSNSDAAGTVQASVQKSKKYVCSMHPQILMDHPGDCPICGMALIEKIEKDQNSLDTLLNQVVRPVNETVLASVQTVNPSLEERPLVIEASGLINFDTRRVNTISARFGGLIEKSFIKYPFQTVHKGQKIFDIYAPGIFDNKIDYIQLIRAYPDRESMSGDARRWLENLGFTKEQIQEIITKNKLNYHLSVYSDQEGFAMGSDFDPENYFSTSSSPSGQESIKSAATYIGLNEGTVIETGTPLLKIVNTESVRADLKIRTEDAGLLTTGQKVMLTDAVTPNRILQATISQIEPLNGGLFQLVKVYITDPKRLLIPGRQIQAVIRAGKHRGLWIPRSAVINLGQHQTAFLLRGNQFIAIPITTGLQSGNMTEIRSGLEQHSKIALVASLLTDSDGFIQSASK